MPKCDECNEEMVLAKEEGKLTYLCPECCTHFVEFDAGLRDYLADREDLGYNITSAAELIAEVVAWYYWKKGYDALPDKEVQNAMDGLRARGYLVFTEEQMKQATIDTLKDLKAKGVI